MMKKRHILLVSLLLSTMPLNTLAYSNSVILGGSNIGIEIQNDGILVVGFYEVNNTYNPANMALGDIITKVNNVPVKTINELIKTIDEQIKDDKVNITYERDNKEYTTSLKLEKENGLYKTGLYVKDKLSGCGTLSYIDPETKVYGALGHEVLESTTNKKIEVRSGYIFDTDVVEIDKSEDGNPGSKTAKFNTNLKYGTIDKNTKVGIYGTFSGDIDTDSLVPVAKLDDVKTGKATILTVLDGKKVEEFEINILKIDKNSKIKNFYFEVTDKELLAKTGGIIQGMSGSPILQNGKLIGAVTHVSIDKVNTGYGISIITMLEEGDK